MTNRLFYGENMIDIYTVEFSEFTYEQYKNLNFSGLDIFKWRKTSQYKGYKHSPSTDAEKATQEDLKAKWENLSLSKAMIEQPEHVEIPWGDRTYTLTYKEFKVYYPFCKLIRIIEIEQPELIDIEALSNSIVTKLTPLLKEKHEK